MVGSTGNANPTLITSAASGRSQGARSSAQPTPRWGSPDRRRPLQESRVVALDGDPRLRAGHCDESRHEIGVPGERAKALRLPACRRNHHSSGGRRRPTHRVEPVPVPGTRDEPRGEARGLPARVDDTDRDGPTFHCRVGQRGVWPRRTEWALVKVRCGNENVIRCDLLRSDSVRFEEVGPELPDELGDIRPWLVVGELVQPPDCHVLVRILQILEDRLCVEEAEAESAAKVVGLSSTSLPIRSSSIMNGKSTMRGGSSEEMVVGGARMPDETLREGVRIDSGGRDSGLFPMAAASFPEDVPPEERRPR